MPVRFEPCQRYLSRKYILKLSALWVGALAAGSAVSVKQASANNLIQFNTSATVSAESCVIQVIQNGTMTANPSSTVLSSKNAGGIGARAIVTSRKRGRGNNPGPRFRVTLEAPFSFSGAPVGGNTNVNFTTRFSGISISRGKNFAERNGTNSVRLRRHGTSVTEITGHLIATKTTGAFPSGSYSGQATLRCE